MVLNEERARDVLLANKVLGLEVKKEQWEDNAEVIHFKEKRNGFTTYYLSDLGPNVTVLRNEKDETDGHATLLPRFQLNPYWAGVVEEKISDLGLVTYYLTFLVREVLGDQADAEWDHGMLFKLVHASASQRCIAALQTVLYFEKTIEG